MTINSFGVLLGEKLLIFNYSFEREFFIYDVRDVFIQKYRAMHVNFLFFLIASLILIRFDLNNSMTCLVIFSLYLISFFLKIYTYDCIILQKRSFVKIKINKKNLKDAQILINLILNIKKQSNRTVLKKTSIYDESN